MISTGKTTPLAFEDIIRIALEKSGYKVPGQKHPQGKTMMIKENKYDTRGHAELEKAKFSGIRANDLWNRIEFWILGQLADTVTYQQFWQRPECLNEKYCELFGLKEMALDDATQREVLRIHTRKEEISQLSEQQKDELSK